MDNTETNVQGTETTATQQEKTFTQAEVDAMIQRRLERDRKKYPSEDELASFREWKCNQQTEQAATANLVRERDEATTNLANATTELDELKRKYYVATKGIVGDEAEFIVFKASRMVTDNVTFEQAVEELLKDRKKPTFDWMAPVGGGTPVGSTLSERINNQLRGR